jgi:hypothetical protein
LTLPFAFSAAFLALSSVLMPGSFTFAVSFSVDLEYPWSRGPSPGGPSADLQTQFVTPHEKASQGAPP